MTSPWLIRTREAAKWCGGLLTIRRMLRLYGVAARALVPGLMFAGGLLVLIIGIVGTFAWVLIWSEVLAP